jgi:hypothetical protein
MWLWVSEAISVRRLKPTAKDNSPIKASNVFIELSWQIIGKEQ